MISLVLVSIAIAGLIPLAWSLPLALLAPRSSNGPVISTNFQDPCVLNISNTYYAFSGPNGNPPLNVQLATSADFNSWTVRSGYDALPNPGPWAASPPHVWAPDVNFLPSGGFVLYFTATVASSPNQHCVGAALSTSVTGPFTPLSAPLTCDLSAGGSIDPDLFIDPLSGALYLIYKVDGNSIATSGGACGNGDGATPTPIMLQQVTENGYTFVGPAIEILANIPSDGAGIEAPTLFYDTTSGLYVLLFNSGCFTSTDYSILYATAPTVTGPYTRRGVLFATGATAGDIQLPGGIDVLGNEDGGGGIRAVLQGDLNLGWFSGQGARDRGMYAIELDVSRGVLSLGGLF